MQNYTLLVIYMGVKLGPTCSKQHRLSAFERWLLRKIVGPKAEDERRLEKMICTSNQIFLSVSRMTTRAGHVVRERRTEMHTRFGGKIWRDHLGEINFEEDNIDMDLKDTGWDRMDWIKQARGKYNWRVHGKGNELSGCIKYSNYLRKL